MEFQGEDVSLLWKLSGQARIDAFEAAYAQFGARLFSFPSFFRQKDFFKLCQSLKSAPSLHKKSKCVQTVAFYQKHYQFGGGERCISYQMPILKALGFNVVLITDWDASTDAYVIPPGVKRLIFGKENSIDVNGVKFGARCELWQKFIKSHNIDTVIHSYTWHDNNLLDFLSIRSAGAYVIYCMHSIFTTPLYRSSDVFGQFANAIQFVDSLIALSRVDQRFYALCKRRSYYIPNKPTFEKLPKLTNCGVNKTLNCLWCARIAPAKSPLEVIPIFKRIHNKIPSATLTILGDTIQMKASQLFKNQMKKQEQTLGLSGVIEWAGYTTDVNPYYEKADLLLITSNREGFPLVTLEAYAHGLPIVSYDMPYLETLKNPKAARCVPQGDQQAAADAAIELLTNPEVYREASLEARKVAEEFMNFDQAAAWKQVIEELPTPYSPEETEVDRVDRVMLETILLHGTWSRLPQQTQQQLAAARKQLAAAQAELKKIRATLTWRIGRMVTFVPRKMRGGLRCLRENGVGYTLRRMVKKIIG
ncbi:MAG: glycosyltransferase [Kiritimatiellae bacterium]|nr:glycosyltransferase [Kiritimatiellia bacterium]